jgi:hypothetical protein
MTNEIIALVANIALALSFIIGLVFGIAQVRTAARDRRERLTMEALRNFQTREFAGLIQYLSSREAPSSWKELKALPPNEQIMYIQFAQEMESLGLMVAERYINIDLVDKTLGSFVTTTWEKYKVVFTDMREKQPDPFLGEYFQWLAERIDKRMKLKPRKPFFEAQMASSGTKH